MMLLIIAVAGSPEAADLVFSGATISAPGPGAEGEPLEIPVTVTGARRLAGVKLTISYDRSLLTFDAMKKTPFSSGMMHVVNDKTPGRLIVVMASATGIPKQDYPLMSLVFKPTGPVEEMRTVALKVEQAEMMDEALKSIMPTVKVEPIMLWPAKNGTWKPRARNEKSDEAVTSESEATETSSNESKADRPLSEESDADETAPNKMEADEAVSEGSGDDVKVSSEENADETASGESSASETASNQSKDGKSVSEMSDKAASSTPQNSKGVPAGPDAANPVPPPSAENPDAASSGSAPPPKTTAD